MSRVHEFKKRWVGGRGREGHQGPSIEATNMMVESSQCHAEKGRPNYFLPRANPMKMIDPTKEG